MCIQTSDARPYSVFRTTWINTQASRELNIKIPIVILNDENSTVLASDTDLLTNQHVL